MLDEALVRINGERHHLWHPVDHEGEIRGSFVTRRQDRASAMSLLKKTMRCHGPAKAIVTDGRMSCKAASWDPNAAGKQQTGRWLRNSVGSSGLSIRRQVPALQRIRQMKTFQNLGTVHTAFDSPFIPDHHLIRRDHFKARRSATPVEWKSLAS